MLFSPTQHASALAAIGAIVCTQSFSNRDVWSTLNQSVHGRLHAASPFALPCFSSYNGNPVEADPGACSSVQRNYASALFRTQFFNGYMNTPDEICASAAGDECLLDHLEPSNPLAYSNKTCNQGSVPDHYIDVQGPNDVVEAFKFAKTNGIRLSIKATGSANSGRNSLKGSLGLWVRHLDNISYNPTFIPEGCSKDFTVQMSVTAGAGVNTDEMLRYADIKNFSYIGAYADVVGVSGGWPQGGGETLLSPVYGLAADRIVQYEVVTPDGVLRTANACQNQDLFWALRGGGGGTFGVVLETTTKVEELFNITVANISFPAKPTNYLPFMDIVINATTQWAQEGWGGQINPGSLINATPLLSLQQANDSLKNALDYALGQNGTVALESLTFFDFYLKYCESPPTPIGNANMLSTRLIPQSMFETASGRAKMLSFLQSYAEQGTYGYIIPNGPILYPYATNSTSATPAWRNSYWLLGLRPPQWMWNSTVAQKRTTVEIMGNITKSLEDLTPGSGTHFNEADPWTKDWQSAFWGNNYERLVEIKRKYDPDRLLNCWRCVGFEEDDPGFECYRGLEG